jgi:hypothetical protein
VLLTPGPHPSRRILSRSAPLPALRCSRHDCVARGVVSSHGPVLSPASCRESSCDGGSRSCPACPALPCKALLPRHPVARPCATSPASHPHCTSLHLYLRLRQHPHIAPPVSSSIAPSLCRAPSLRSLPLQLNQQAVRSHIRRPPPVIPTARPCDCSRPPTAPLSETRHCTFPRRARTLPTPLQHVPSPTPQPCRASRWRTWRA